jgi:hypothetical protein
MADTILETMDSWKRVAGSAAEDGSFTPFVIDKPALEALAKLAVTLGDALKALQTISADVKTTVTTLQGIRARLDGGIKTQAGTIAVTV